MGLVVKVIEQGSGGGQHLGTLTALAKGNGENGMSSPCVYVSLK